MSKYQFRQLADELQPPESGKQSIVLTDDEHAKVILFAFAAGAGLAEHVAAITGNHPHHQRRGGTDCRRTGSGRKAGHLDSNGSQDAPQYQGRQSDGHVADFAEIR